MDLRGEPRQNWPRPQLPVPWSAPVPVLPRAGSPACPLVLALSDSLSVTSASVCVGHVWLLPLVPKHLISCTGAQAGRRERSGFALGLPNTQLARAARLGLARFLASAPSSPLPEPGGVLRRPGLAGNQRPGSLPHPLCGAALSILTAAGHPPGPWTPQVSLEALGRLPSNLSPS